MKMKPPIYKKINLDFMDDYLIMVAANTISECFDYLKNYYPLEQIDYGGSEPKACFTYHQDIGCILMFRHDSVEGYLICHEVGHVTNHLFALAGIPLTDATDEAYCYHNSMLFKYVANFFKENNIKIKL